MEEANARLLGWLTTIVSKHSAVLFEAQALDTIYTQIPAQNEELQAQVRQLRALLLLRPRARRDQATHSACFCAHMS